jgi:hypothetical protein
LKAIYSNDPTRGNPATPVDAAVTQPGVATVLHPGCGTLHLVTAVHPLTIR